MASIYKKGKVYYASFKDCEGRQRQASTRIGNKCEAQNVADRLELPYHLTQFGSEAVLLHLASSLRQKALDTANELAGRLEESDPEVNALIHETEFSSLVARLEELLSDLDEAERYPYAKVIQKESSFTGMPPEADLEIRIGLRRGKRRGGGSRELHLSTRLLCELQFAGALLDRDPQRRIWKRAWASLGDTIFHTHRVDGLPLAKVVRSAADLLAENNTRHDFDLRPDSLEAQVFWYAACCFKKNKRVVPRKTVHSVIGASRDKDPKPTINRILQRWEEVCGKFDPNFRFPETADGDRVAYDDLAEHFMKKQDLRRAHTLYWKL